MSRRDNCYDNAQAESFFSKFKTELLENGIFESLKMPNQRSSTISKAAESALDKLEEKWGEKYPIVIRSWRRKWDNLSHYFRYPEPIRKGIYMTNSIETVHRQFRKLTKTKGGFPNENSLLKLLYMGIKNAQKKWTIPIKNWSLTLSQLAIFFEGRFDEALTIWKSYIYTGKICWQTHCLQMANLFPNQQAQRVSYF